MTHNIEQRTATTFAVLDADGATVALVEVFDDSVAVYGPRLEPDSSPIEGPEAAFFAAFYRDDNNNLRPAGGRFTLRGGVAAFDDVVGDAGRQVALDALAAWDSDPGTPERFRSARAAALRAGLVELEDALTAAQAAVARANLELNQAVAAREAAVAKLDALG